MLCIGVQNNTRNHNPCASPFLSSGIIGPNLDEGGRS
jgi:hypothetical protein